MTLSDFVRGNNQIGRCTTWPSFPFACRLLFIIYTHKWVISGNCFIHKNCLSCFYLLSFYFEKFSIEFDVCCLPYTWSLNSLITDSVDSMKIKGTNEKWKLKGAKPLAVTGIDRLCWHNFKHGHNFHAFPEKSTADIICTFGTVLQHQIVIIDLATNFCWPEIRVTGKFKKQNQCFVCLLSHSWDLGPTGSDLRPFHRSQCKRITEIARLPKMASVRWFLFEFYSLFSENEFLDENRLNVCTIYIVIHWLLGYF